MSTKKNKSKQPRGNRRISTIPPPEATNRLISLYRQGNLSEAEADAQSLSERFPHHNLAWKVLGAIRKQQGSLEEALTAMERARMAMPEDYICLRNIAVLLCDLGRHVEAEKYGRQALAMRTDYADAHNTLSIALRSQHKLAEAEQSCRHALKLQPDSSVFLVNLGLILNDQQRFTDAESTFLHAIELNPSLAEAHCGLGITQWKQNKLEEAESASRQALVLKPHYAEAYNTLGCIFDQRKEYHEAEPLYRKALRSKPSYPEALQNLGKTIESQNRFMEAEHYYRQVLEVAPNNAEAFYNLGNTLAREGRHTEAEDVFRAALKIQPAYLQALLNLGNSLREQGLITKAEESYRTALAIEPEYNEARNNLGGILQEQGRLAESEQVFRLIIEKEPYFLNALSNLLFLSNYHPDKSGAEIFQEYLEFEKRFGRPLQAEWPIHSNSKEKFRRLKIGYVSPQFCRHPVCNFLEPLLAWHNKKEFEIFAYAELYKEDDATKRYKAYMDHWIPTKGMTESDMAERIRADGIDILVDLAGHTGHNRLLVFARKPAPISLHWLDFGYTTGLKAIDYYLTDHATVPTEDDGLFSEIPWRIDTPCLAYRPTEGMGEVNTLPAIEHGHITFGSLSRAVRINHRTIRVWSEIMKGVAGSHLIINSGNFNDPVMQERLANRFVSYGIERNRLAIGCTSPPWDVLRSIDIGLDCFPHNSGTTLIESLYMGIPFITLAGRPSVGRLGSSVLHGVGHTEWIARTEDEYIDTAIRLAQDLPRLAELRGGLRQKMAKSPLMDEPAFTRKVEAAYREMFSKWCEEHK